MHWGPLYACFTPSFCKIRSTFLFPNPFAHLEVWASSLQGWAGRAQEQVVWAIRDDSQSQRVTWQRGGSRPLGQCQKQVEVAELLSRAENCTANLPASSPLWDLVNLYVTWDLFCSACKWEHMFICKYTMPFPAFGRRNTPVLVGQGWAGKRLPVQVLLQGRAGWLRGLGWQREPWGEQVSGIAVFPVSPYPLMGWTKTVVLTDWSSVLLTKHD